MNPKITPEHLSRTAVVYVRQSTPGQVAENTESQQRQYALVESARAMGFTSVVVIDDDLGRSGSGLVERPGFQKLVALVCGGSIGAVLHRSVTSRTQRPRLASPDRLVRPGRHAGERSRWCIRPTPGQ
jgi:DNA invertase Pin-like site-specific DNA recombinase